MRLQGEFEITLGMKGLPDKSEGARVTGATLFHERREKKLNQERLEFMTSGNALYRLSYRVRERDAMIHVVPSEPLSERV